MKKIEAKNHFYRHGRFVIPADSRAAMDFYLQNLMVPHSRREMFLAPIARSSGIFPKMLFSNGGKNNGFKSESNVDSMKSLVLLTPVLVARLKRAGVEIKGAAKLLLLGDYGHSARGQSVVFVFDTAAKMPVAVAKIRAFEQRRALEREFQTLKNLAQTLPGKLRKTVPQPFDLFTDSGFTILLESAIQGCSVHFELRGSFTPRRRAEKHFSAAFGWLAAFHRATQTREIRFGELRTGEFANSFQKLRESGEISEEEDDFIGEIVTAAESFDDEKIPLSMVQGDFWTRNIILDKEKTGVVDWEHFQAEGCSLDDALMFAVSYGRGYPWKFGRWISPEKAFARTFYDDSWFARAIVGQMQKFCRELGINEKLLEIFLAVFLARQAVGEFTAGSEKEVTVWRNLFRENARAAKKRAFSG